MSSRFTSNLRRYFSTCVGQDGRDVPLNADWLWPWWTWPLAVLGMAVFLFLAPFVGSLGSLLTDWSWQHVAEIAPFLGLWSVVGATVVILIPVAFWPFTRKQLGRILEDEVRGWTLDRLDEEISRQGSAWRMSSQRLTSAHRRRLAWLYVKREELHGVSPPASIVELMDVYEP